MDSIKTFSVFLMISVTRLRKEVKLSKLNLVKQKVLKNLNKRNPRRNKRNNLNINLNHNNNNKNNK